jgi:aminoglycoside phosphotransferase family enzyme
MVHLGIREKVAFLNRPDAYPGGTSRVETKQTHMSWVFLTDSHAWKLKKPVRYDYLDFSTPEARRKDCEEEVTLNRRLAPSVYIGVVPLTADSRGNLQLQGQGQPVDWLVQMRRLPSDRMLDQAIADHTWTHDDLHKVGILLADFYKHSPPIRITGAEYRSRLNEDLDSTQRELTRSQYALPVDLVRSVIAAEMRCLERDADLFDERVRAGKIIEAHGDLRAEHICLERQPVIIDCLEFNRTFRILDPASELTFLALECERLGAPRVGELILNTYRAETGDQPPDQILGFYRGYHACLRAKIAVWHLRDHEVDTAKWINRALHYLELASSVGAPI